MSVPSNVVGSVPSPRISGSQRQTRSHTHIGGYKLVERDGPERANTHTEVVTQRETLKEMK